MFIPINVSSLQQGIKYKIIINNEWHFRGKFDNGFYFNHVWFNNKYLGTIQFADTDIFYYYVSIKECIQQNMEKRALNSIIQRITGDVYFTW